MYGWKSKIKVVLQVCKNLVKTWFWSVLAQHLPLYAIRSNICLLYQKSMESFCWSRKRYSFGNIFWNFSKILNSLFIFFFISLLWYRSLFWPRIIIRLHINETICHITHEWPKYTTHQLLRGYLALAVISGSNTIAQYQENASAVTFVQRGHTVWSKSKESSFFKIQMLISSLVFLF